MNDIKIIYSNLHEVKCKDCGCDVGDSSFTVFHSELNLERLESSGITTKSGLAEYLHITEKELDDLYDGKYNVVIGPDNIPLFLDEYHSLDGNGRAAFASASQHDKRFEIYNFGNEWANGYAWD